MAATRREAMSSEATVAAASETKTSTPIGHHSTGGVESTSWVSNPRPSAAMSAAVMAVISAPTRAGITAPESVIGMAGTMSR